MTTIAEKPTADGTADRVRQLREAKDDSVSRAEGWRRRGPLLPALIFMIVVTQIPFLFTLYYSTQSGTWSDRGPRPSSACRITWMCSRTASSVRSRSTP